LPERRDDAAGDEHVLGRHRHYALPQSSIVRRPGVRSISAPRDVRSPRRVRAASAAIAAYRPLSVRRLTDLKPSIAPSAFAPASPSIAISRRSYGASRTASPSGARSGTAAARYALSARPGRVSSWLPAFAARPTRRAPGTLRVRTSP